MSFKKTELGFALLLLLIAFAWYSYRKPRFIAGETVPDFTVATLQGDSIRSTDFRGHYLLIQFWGSWCGPCRAENRELTGLYAQFHPKGFEILSIGIESNGAAWRRAIASDGLIWPYHSADMLQFDGNMARLFNVHSIPTTFLVNPDGRIIAVNAQPAEIEQILAQKLAGH